VQAAFTVLVSTGVFQRFPHLKYVILESGGGWIAHWLDRMDGKYKVGKEFSPLKEKPSFYFQRQCYISVDPDEKTTPAMVELLGEDHFVWCPSRKPEDMNMLDFFLACCHPGPVHSRSCHSPSR
jgi:predicted TIM-barrel fold metal-dependent hydrolase